MIKKLILFLLSFAMIVFVYQIVNSELYPQPSVPVLPVNDWLPFVAQYREAGALSFIWDMEPGAQTFVLAYTDVEHWTRTILSSTVQGAANDSATLDSGILTRTSPSSHEIYTETVDFNLAPNEWLSYSYLSNLQKKPTVFLRKGPQPGEMTAVETFERPCFPFFTKAGIKECGNARQNSIVIREFTYRTEDYILTKLVSKVDGVVIEDVTLESLTFK